MAFSRGLPLLVMPERGVRSEGLLERGFDWYVQSVKVDPVALTTIEFNSILASWKQKMLESPKQEATSLKAPSDLTIRELVGGLKPSQLWSMLGTLAAVIGGAFTLGAKLCGS